jgi:hypothetical protein
MFRSENENEIIPYVKCAIVTKSPKK